MIVTRTPPSRVIGRSLLRHVNNRSTSSLWNTTSNRTITTSSAHCRQEDLDHAVALVKSHDPSGLLPGRLLPNTEMQTAYFAVRSFWVETGLRFGSTAQVAPNATPREHLEWWQQSLDGVYADLNNKKEEEENKGDSVEDWRGHPTLRLMHGVIQESATSNHSASTKTPLLSKIHFDDVLQGRRNDLDLKQYPTLQHLEDHAVLSCGSLAQLVLESGNMTSETHPVAHQAARLVGMGHGLTNALRTSIPVISTTGKLIVPEDLCQKYGITSPRYLLSALGQGDTKAQQAMAQAVQEIAEHAQSHLQAARDLRTDVLAEDPKAVSVLLPALASETFLQRLQESGYNLTDRNLRNVGFLEHWQCATRMIMAYYQQKY
ncbi:NADH dehydrogenase (ubiquinone) complex I, assembly factor 6 [Seminavis robusta]|uniref:NADH dehydrogenase (Ubiquinone) complex I, assembly factor 6 n=1 Tax=Seminavis robusta TaxID=568900 RepID=A0A9N8HWH0_9STRA|nr:NADH dehydrogenase (ubiquinone) complex I, assembly factor 6 [Seminavis robusta]|eukprot:Sro1648_g288490.1 NADH dehydrogenase (ubiquinone) complex I, assembly factor 6 (375) ;mRNA; f:13731-14855